MLDLTMRHAQLFLKSYEHQNNGLQQLCKQERWSKPFRAEQRGATVVVVVALVKAPDLHQVKGSIPSNPPPAEPRRVTELSA